eukprot:7384745-Prymnesium_polylepis.1
MADDSRVDLSQNESETGHMWVSDLGLALRVRPGMTARSGADFSAPGLSPCPLRGSRPTYTDCKAEGRLSVPRL